MKVVICDKDKEAAAQAAGLLEHIAAERGLELEIRLLHSAGECLIFCQKHRPQLVILETILTGQPGTQLAAALRQQLGMSFSLIFLTSCNDFAAESYDVNADNYLLKPAGKKQLEQALARCGLFEKADFIYIRDGRDSLKISLRQLLAVEVLGKVCRLHMLREEHEVKNTLSHIRAQLPESIFWSVHRSYIINITCAVSLQGYDFVLQNGFKVPVSRSRFAAIKRDYISWRFEHDLR